MLASLSLSFLLLFFSPFPDTLLGTHTEKNPKFYKNTEGLISLVVKNSVYSLLETLISWLVLDFWCSPALHGSAFSGALNHLIGRYFRFQCAEETGGTT